MITSITKRREVEYVCASASSLLVLYLIHDIHWFVKISLYTTLSIICSSIVLFASLLALIRFHSQKDRQFLFFGFGLLGTAVISSYHTLVTSAVLPIVIQSPPPHLITWSAYAQELILSGFIFCSLLQILLEKRMSKLKKILTEKWVAFITIFSTGFFLFLFTFTPLSSAYNTAPILGVDFRYIPTTLLLGSLVIHLKLKKWARSSFNHHLTNAIILHINATLCLLLSSQVYDTFFFVSEICKLAAYIILLYGLFKGTAKIFKREQETKYALKKESEERRKFKLAVESASEAIAISNRERTLLYVNKAWENLTGYSSKEAIGKQANFIRSPLCNPHIRKQAHESLKNGEGFSSDEFINQKKNGEDYTVEIQIWPIIEENATTNFVEFQHDITKRKRAEEAQTEFVGFASHQLRTPLTAIRWSIGRLEKYLKDILDSKSKRVIESMQKATARMAETIGAMLTISRIEAGKIAPEVTKISVHDLLTDICSHLSNEYNHKKQKCVLECSNDTIIETDEKLLREIVTNFLSNAIKYTPEKGKLFLRVIPVDSNIRIEVEDTGYGIPSEQQEKVFQKFFRAENIRDKDPDGTGLGLHLVYSLAHILHGKVYFSSEENKGTLFALTLPLSPPDNV